jgi:hypothetical protein
LALGHPGACPELPRRATGPEPGRGPAAPRVRAVNNPRTRPLPGWAPAEAPRTSALGAKCAARNTDFVLRNTPNRKFSQIRIRYTSMQSMPPTAMTRRNAARHPLQMSWQSRKKPRVSPTPQARATGWRKNASAQRRRREPRTAMARRQPPECHFGVRPMTRTGGRGGALAPATGTTGTTATT